MKVKSKLLVLILVLVALLSAPFVSMAQMTCEPGFIYWVVFLGDFCFVVDQETIPCVHCGEEIVVWG